jgi:hypothetical protein
MTRAVTRTTFAFLLVGALVATAGTARAQTQATYVEQKTSDRQDIRFRDDPMTALAGNPVGAQLSGFHPPKRFDLMHPRKTFVPELLKSVEHM